MYIYILIIHIHSNKTLRKPNSLMTIHNDNHTYIYIKYA